MHGLVENYVALAEQWRNAMDSHDAEKANGISSQIDRCLAQIHAKGLESEILSLVTHESDAVKLFANAVLKMHRPADAKKVYQELARSPLPYIAVSAKYIAREL